MNKNLNYHLNCHFNVVKVTFGPEMPEEYIRTSLDLGDGEIVVCVTDGTATVMTSWKVGVVISTDVVDLTTEINPYALIIDKITLGEHFRNVATVTQIADIVKHIQTEEEE